MESTTLTPVDPVSPAAGYIGGKRNLSKRLVARIASTPHTLYAEPFVGMGGVFFRHASRPAAEVINDISSDVANLFRILQRHYEAFMGELKWKLSSRAEFERLMKVDPDALTDIERAARFLYLQRNTFGGKVTGRSFGVTRTNPARFDPTKLVPMLESIHDRLTSVIIERLPYDRFIARYDAPGTLFYLDPPYHGCEDDYDVGVFSAADYERLRDLLEAIQGRFIMSINDTLQIRAIFAGMAMEDVGVSYRLSGAATQARELIISAP